MQAVLAFLPTLLTITGSLPKIVGAIQFIVGAIIEAEQPGQTGDQKLDAVLNSFETYINSEFPQYSQPFDTIASDVEAVVKEIVGLFNAFAKPSVKS